MYASVYIVVQPVQNMNTATAINATLMCRFLVCILISPEMKLHDILPVDDLKVLTLCYRMNVSLGQTGSGIGQVDQR